jgi:hypothetical protein
LSAEATTQNPLRPNDEIGFKNNFNKDKMNGNKNDEY